MPDRNARLARLMGLSPALGISLADDGSTVAHEQWPQFDSAAAPRCLLESVEREIERRGKVTEYVSAIWAAAQKGKPGLLWVAPEVAARAMITAPATTRVDAAIEVLGGAADA